MNRKIVIPAVALFWLTPSIQAGGPPQLENLRFLIGAWRATGSGTPGEATGTAEFLPALDGRIMIRKSYAEYPSSPGKPAYRHEDLMVISVEADSTVTADYYDNEGHVIRYSVGSTSPGKVEFLSMSSRTGPRYRLTYSLDAAGTLEGRFEVAPHGGGGNFTTYLKWSSHKDRAGTAPDR